MRKLESIFVALLLVGVALYAIFESVYNLAPKVSYVVYGERDASQFPLIIASFLLIMAVINIFKEVKNPPDTKEEDAILASLPKNENPKKLVRLSWFLFVFMVVDLIAMNYVGYHIATFVFLGVAFFALGSRSWIMVLFASLGITYLTYFIFNDMLNLILPYGIIW